VKAVLFDLDGTLTNTLEDIADAMNRALRHFDLPVWSVDDYRYLVGNGARILAQRAVRDRQDLAEEVLSLYQERYGAHSQDRTRPYEGIPELLAALNRAGLPVCVLSNKPHADTEKVIAHYFPEINFAVVLGQTDRFPIKPDPAPARWIAEYLGLLPQDFAYLGDTAVDMDCATAAGMQAFGVLWGFRTAQELKEHGARYLLANPADLLTYLS